MSCANATDHSLVALPSTRASWRWTGFIEIIVAIHDAFRGALEMRRTAHKKYRLSDQ
jgi:hypothetical protein